MDSSKLTLITILRERVGELCNDGNYWEAMHAANAAVERAEQELSMDLDSIEVFALTLELRGDLYRIIGELENARDDYRHGLDQLDGRLELSMPIGRLHAALGAVHDELGNAERAIHHWDLAVSYFEKTSPPASLDIAALLNNIASLKKSLSDVDGAENCLLKALEILHHELGKDHEETACVCNNLGALYQHSGFHEQAREMHLMALQTRRKLFGEYHQDIAQSYNNLALALMQTGDTEMAQEHFETALQILTECGPDAQDELISVSENYLDFLRRDGSSDDINHVEERVKSTLAQWA